MRKPPAEQLPAELMAHSLMALTSALLLLEHGSLKCTGVMVEEQQLKPLATLPAFPALVSSVQLMGRSNSMGVRKGTTGSHTLSPTTDVSTTKAMVKTVAMEHSKEAKMALGLTMATMTPLTNTSVKGTVVFYTVIIDPAT